MCFAANEQPVLGMMRMLWVCCAGEDADDAGDEILGRQDSWDGWTEAEEH